MLDSIQTRQNVTSKHNEIFKLSMIPPEMIARPNASWPESLYSDFMWNMAAFMSGLIYERYSDDVIALS